MKKTIIITLLSCLLFPAISYARSNIETPFGISIGTNKETLKKYAIEPIKNIGFQHILVSPPSKSQLFNLYSVFYTSETGVCAILATKENIETDQKGDQLTSKYNELVRLVSKKYASPNSQINTLDTDSEYNIFKLKSKEVKIESHWELSNKISDIFVSATSSDGITGTINLFYYGKNFKRCLEIREKELSNTL